MIRQGEIYWCDLGQPIGSAPGFHRPVVVIQNDVFDGSGLSTTVVCGLTPNLRRSRPRGNVVLGRGEAMLSEASVVNVTQILTVDKSQLEKRIGRISPERLTEVLTGPVGLIEPRNFRPA
jgi:mRNA interferase MazF